MPTPPTPGTPPGAPPAPARDPDALAAERAALAERRYEIELAASREERRLLVRAALACFGWSFAGLAGIAVAMHDDQLQRGRTTFAVAVILANAMIIRTIYGVRQRLDELDWGE